jgi:hypothetical protein
MFKKQIAVLFCLFFLSQIAFSNAKPFPGYYVRLNGDTVHCNIEFNDKNITPNSIRVDVNKQVQEFGPGDIRAYGIEGYGDYIAAKVSYHLNPTAVKDLQNHFSDSVITQTRFLKILDRGHYSLYDLMFSQRSYYFISVRDSAITELVYRIKITGDTLVEDAAYKQQLFTLFLNEGLADKHINRINTCHYNSSELESLIQILNENHSGTQYQKKPSGTIQVQAFAGMIMNSFPGQVFLGYTKQPASFSNANSIGGGVNFLYSIPGHFKAFNIGLSLGYNGYNNQFVSSTTKDTLTAKNSLLMANLYFQYVVNPLSEVKFYLKAGASYNFSMSGDVNVYQTIDGSPISTPVKQNFPGIILSAGVIAGRSSLEFTYSPPVQIADPGNDFDSPVGKNFKFGYMALYYYFTIFPFKK